MKAEDFTKIFRSYIRGHDDFNESLELVKKNSEGKIWVIGSFVYRNIIEKVYNVKFPEPAELDIDFLVEKIAKNRGVKIPENWDLKMTNYGNLYFLKGRVRVDLNYLSNFHSIWSRKLEPKIENQLTGTPLTIQSIAYDYNEKKIIGNRGMVAIKEKLVTVNNIDEADYEAKKKGMSLENFAKLTNFQ